MVKWFYIVVFALLFSGCNREQMDDCITSAGPESTDVRKVGPFSSIDISERIDLVLEQRAITTISINAGSNLLDQVSTEVRDGVLYIKNDNRCNWVRSFKPRITVYVPISEVEKLVLRGQGNISTSDTLRRPSFSVQQYGAQGTTTLTVDVGQIDIGLHTGAGNVELYGRCSATANLYSGIMAPIDASGMQARYINVNNSGVSDIRCWATVWLTVQIRDVGDVYYRNVPLAILQNEITGSGQLIAY